MNQIVRAVTNVKNKMDFAEKMLGFINDLNGGKDFTKCDFRCVAYRVDKRPGQAPSLDMLVNYGVLSRKKVVLGVTTPAIYCCYHFEDGTSCNVPYLLSSAPLASHIRDHGSLMSMDVRASVDNIRETCYKYVYNFTPEFAADPKKFMRDNMTRMVMDVLESAIDN